MIVTSVSPQTPSATSRVAVSDEVVWPFYASTREALLDAARDPALIAEILDELGVSSGAVQLTAEPTAGEIMVELNAEADDADLAVAAANQYADAVVAAGTRRTESQRLERIDDLTARISEIDVRIAENDSALAELGAAIDALGDDPLRADQAVLESQLQRVESAQREDARVQTSLVQSLSEVRLDLERTESDFSVIRRADGDEASALREPTVVALLVGLPLFLVGLGASVVWDQTFGLLRHADDARLLSRAPVMTVRWRGSGDDAEITDANSFARRVYRHHQTRGSRWLLIPLGSTAERLSARLAEAVTYGRDDLTDEETNGSAREHNVSQYGTDAPPPPGSDPMTEPTSRNGNTKARSVSPDNKTRNAHFTIGPLASLDTAASGSVSGAVVAFSRGNLRVPALRRALGELEAEDLPLEAIVMFDERRR